VAPRYRLTIRSIDPDPRAAKLADSAAHLGLTLTGAVSFADLVFVEGGLTAEHRRRLADLLVDPLLQTGTWDVPDAAGVDTAVEVAFLPGVTDGAAAALLRAAELLELPVTAAASGRRVEFGSDSAQAVAAVTTRLIANPVIERWTTGPIEPAFVAAGAGSGVAEVIPIADRTLDELVELGRQRALALDPAELQVIQAHYAELGREPTDVELETLAQTWSEHCAHKTFRARITTDDGVERASLIAQLRQATTDIDASFVRSAFVGNAGIVALDPQRPDHTLAVKAETHNHPSAVEPFGGANTGVGGVIRDVLGIGHRPVAVTDILCFGEPDTPLAAIPEGALHPLRIRDGVIDGVADYGNKIGLPTVAGAVLYDPGYTTNPLVFAGCIGEATGWQADAGPFPGDRVIVLGGRTGRDGIRGATFSSLTMDATTGAVAGASVQIGEPIVEKLLIDVLVGAEGWYSAITDCGAGGLSSAIGEMAEQVGADVELDRVPLKYPGLEPWEIWLSEAQERMVVAVPPESVAGLADRCRYHGVEYADLGEFTGDGVLVVRSGGTPVLDLPTKFLHDGRPQRQLTATMPTPVRTPAGRRLDDPAAALLALLGHRNIASKASTVHRYDHEIGGATVGRPLVGRLADAPGDGTVMAHPTATAGYAIGIGVNPWYGLHDPERMAWAAVDEAIRNVVAVGADPDRVALLDNFSWGDPGRPTTLGELVAAVDGCCDAARAHAAPYVSGKDSLNNEYTGADGRRHSVPPTLVITALAAVPDAGRTVTSALTAAGNHVVLVGTTTPEFAGSHLDLVLGAPAAPGCAPAPDPAAPARYRALHHAILAGLVASCHDVSEGGLAVALAEMCIGGRLGVAVATLPHADLATALFAESTGRLLVEVAPEHLDTFLNLVPGQPLGTVTDEAVLSIPDLAPLAVETLADTFTTGTLTTAAEGRR